ncbi:hypothetical protein HYH02_005443 [Chlamydomonas schloesseri]|uniref:Uncharacterized protein n=1 Tax=Chlamydomonas schloesseri TaxID=2026947 RepID=A0A836B6Q0_9CHLO|nr:hypothetical protein HYH02_005443 [Chlamydomonas schloesseri]|eukprot:KAG2449286.1 hypothetical protein HYH02_005443 [Chlamydomonas schloesseri]
MLPAGVSVTVYMNYTSSSAFNFTLAACAAAARAKPQSASAFVALAVVNNDPLTSRFMCIGLQLPSDNVQFNTSSSAAAAKLPSADACANGSRRSCTAGAGVLPDQQVPCNGGAKKVLEVLPVYSLSALGKGF